MISCSVDAEPDAPNVVKSGISPENLAEQMKLLYKDEHLRSRLMELALAEKSKYQPETIADHVWNAIKGDGSDS